MTDYCLFCREQLVEPLDARPEEHTIPEVLGGKHWLRTTQVCGPCNHALGTQVDKIGADELFFPYREEVGLPIAPEHEPEAIVFLTGSDDLVRGRMRTGQRFEAKRDIDYDEDGKHITITAPTLDAALQMRDDFTRKAAERRRQQITWGTPEHFEDYGPSMVAEEAKHLDELEVLLPREAAKVAIEYIGLRYGADIALDSRLDPLREFARHGTEGPITVVGGSYYTGLPVYLPRTNQLQRYDERGSPRLSPEEQQQLAVDEQGNPRPPPPDAVHLTQLMHQVEVRRVRDRLFCAITIFSCFWLYVELPNDLPIHHDILDTWDFTLDRAFRTPAPQTAAEPRA